VRSRRVVTVLVATCGVLLAAGCSADRPVSEPAASSPSGTPTLGGAMTDPARPPQREMDRLERQVHERLASQVAGQGLTMQYLDCPHWDGDVPARMTCRGYVDDVLARVSVRLRAAVEGKAVGFDAKLLDGVIATRNLERTLRDQGWQDPDCGGTAAYPAVVGNRIVCRVHRKAEQRYVVATVSSRAGAVMITDYRSAAPSS
jgi:hypothetical protein